MTSSNGEPDNIVAAEDALTIINYINSFSAGLVPLNATVGSPFGYLDTDRDNFVAPGDALSVINWINAFGTDSSGPEGNGTAQGQSAAELHDLESVPSDSLFENLAGIELEQIDTRAADTNSGDMAEIIALLANDQPESFRRRRLRQ